MNETTLIATPRPRLMSGEDIDFIIAAKKTLETKSLAEVVSEALGKPFELGMKLIPRKITGAIDNIANTSLSKGYDFVSRTTSEKGAKKDGAFGHKMAAVGSGFLGGALGGAALAAELPLTTMIMLRSIVKIALRNGESIDDPTTKIGCLEVFAMGANDAVVDPAKSAYYAARTLVASQADDAIKFIARNGLTSKAAKDSAPVIVKFLNTIAARYGIVISEKVALQALPILGGAAGAAINAVFIDRYTKTASAHFGIRRLERKYGRPAVEDVYKGISDEN